MWKQLFGDWCVIKYRNPELLFHGKRVDLYSIETDHPKGGVIRREVVAHPGAVVILPLLDPDTVILIKNERYVVQKTLWELPAGTLETEEEPITCAKRELIEETGYSAKRFTPLLKFYSSPGFCNEELFVYVAEELEFVGQNLDETEEIETIPVRLTEAYKMIREGIICDAKTICALLYFQDR